MDFDPKKLEVRKLTQEDVSAFHSLVHLFNMVFEEDENAIPMEVEANIEEVGKETQSETAFSKPVIFIKGARSGYIKPQYDTEPIQKLFPAAQIKTVENAGHWVHAEAPQEVFNLVTEFLK